MDLLEIFAILIEIIHELFYVFDLKIYVFDLFYKFCFFHPSIALKSFYFVGGSKILVKKNYHTL